MNTIHDRRDYLEAALTHIEYFDCRVNDPLGAVLLYDEMAALDRAMADYERRTCEDAP